MPEIELKPVPFEEAIDAFRGKVPLKAHEFYALTQEARAKAFTVSGVAQMDILMDMHGAIDKAIEAGETLADFRNRVDDIFQARGWTAPEALTPWRMETIFRNNVQTAYSTGRYKQMMDQVDAFPYWEYDTAGDLDVRPSHAAHEGKIYPADHPFWDTWYPPNGHNCRCGVNPVHRSVVEEEGLTVETEDPTGGLYEPIDPVTGNKMPARPLLPDPGWGRNPAKAFWRPDLKKYPDQLVTEFKKKAETIDEAVSDMRARIKAAEKPSQYNRIITQKLGERYGFKGKVKLSVAGLRYADDMAEGMVLGFDTLPAGLRHDIAIKDIRVRKIARNAAGIKEWACDISIHHFLPVANVRDTIIHEIGHGVHHSVPAYHRAQWNNIFTNLPEGLFPTAYAKKDPCELFAESFKLFCQKKPLCPQIQELMEKTVEARLFKVSLEEAQNMVREIRHAGSIRSFSYR